MAVYVQLAGAVGPEATTVEVPVQPSGVAVAEMLSGDRARVQEAAALLEEHEADRDGFLYQAVREQLLSAMRDPAQTARVRVSAGDGLALVGDPRFRPDAWHLPDKPLLGFVEIPEGPFLMGTHREDIPSLLEQFGGDRGWYESEVPQCQVELPTYYIAHYPVTVAQFRAFVEASGHKPADETSARGLDNHSVTWVNWHDALVYCEWLTEKLRRWKGTPEPLATLLREGGWTVTLPSEAEWEKAARGTDGRVFPWGDETDPERANYGETVIGSMSAVGCFLYKEYPYDPKGGREDLDMTGRRVVRGGSFAVRRRFVRCAYRYRVDPGYLYGDQGFRLAVACVGGNSAVR
jgi:formylglycine-generating enzyme required for sulfatase activity